jgi:hypothetical protein
VYQPPSNNDWYSIIMNDEEVGGQYLWRMKWRSVAAASNERNSNKTWRSLPVERKKLLTLSGVTDITDGAGYSVMAACSAKWRCIQCLYDIMLLWR